MAIEFFVRKDTNTLIVADSKVVCDMNMLDTIVLSAKDSMGAAKFATVMTAASISQPREHTIPSQGATLETLIAEGLVTKLGKFEDIVDVEL